PEANLLNKISVKSTTSLIQTEDPFDIFNYDIDDEDLEKLKNEKILIKPGVISGFWSLKDALKRKVNEQSAQPKRKVNEQSAQPKRKNNNSDNNYLIRIHHLYLH
ncbi:unnamed protein product, partial [Rotaria magnacalcarata]